MFHPDAFKWTSKAFQACVILCGKYGIAALPYIYFVLFSLIVLSAAVNPSADSENISIQSICGGHTK